MHAKIVDLAREWIGTPYCHQSSVKGAGCDCLGLLRGIWRELYGAEPAALPAYTMDWDEVARTDVLRDAAETYLNERPKLEPEKGDLILFRMRSNAVAKHLGICSEKDGRSFIHAYTGHGVVESALTTPWRRRISGIFAFPSTH
ncbi:MAG: NlpC/P60 family protein [Boseongicola sp.]